jgi:alkylation response protein AidB-like acyl-CoA dehydrogenase
MRKSVFGLIVLLVLGFVLVGCATTNTGNKEQTTLVITELTGSKIQAFAYTEGKGGTPSATIGSSYETPIVDGVATIPLVKVNTSSPWTGNGGVYDVIIDIDAAYPPYKINSKKLETGEISIPFSDFTAYRYND